VIPCPAPLFRRRQFDATIPFVPIISETFLTAQNREQGEKEMNHD